MTENKDKILIVGSGAVASALAKNLKEHTQEIYVAPGNNIPSDKYKNVDIREDDLTELLKFALDNEITLTIPVSEKALRSDIVSFFQSNGQNIFGPVKDACNIAINKAAGKKFLYKLHAQTSKFGIFDKIQMAEDWLSGKSEKNNKQKSTKEISFPVTIKCSEKNTLGDRLVCSTMTLAREFLDNLFSKGETSVLIEEFVFGHNFTVYYMTDGYGAIPFAVVGNYKFAQDGDGGLYTNGAGCYTPDYKVNDTILSRVSNIIKNSLSSLEKNGTPYVGILGIDCTITGDDKFYVNEFKPFLQDFDAAAVLNLVQDNLINIFNACTQGLFADEYEDILLNNLSSVSAVVTSRSSDTEITGLEMLDDTANIDFTNNGCKQTNDGKILTGVGDIFVLTRSASTLTRAKTYLYEDLSYIDFSGIKYRKDICLE